LEKLSIVILKILQQIFVLNKELTNMPIKRYDSNSGGIVFDLTPEEEEMQNIKKEMEEMRELMKELLKNKEE
jgi:hypothetical protein